MTVTRAPVGLVVVSTLMGVGSVASDVVAASGCVSKAVAMMLWCEGLDPRVSLFKEDARYSGRAAWDVGCARVLMGRVLLLGGFAVI